jgi:molybdopterin molybdotransferase
MPSYEEARQIILEHVSILPPETVPALAAVGRVLASDVLMPWDMPAWDNSAMDGFAVRSGDCTGPVRLRVTGYIPAGGVPQGAVGPHEIMIPLLAAGLKAGA